MGNTDGARASKLPGALARQVGTDAGPSGADAQEAVTDARRLRGGSGQRRWAWSEAAELLLHSVGLNG
ncbi:hypothetical protein NHF46_22600 [Arthrobacter alpinus]|nr:hypothetical protein [Arthrobacter alpinus]